MRQRDPYLMPVILLALIGAISGIIAGTLASGKEGAIWGFGITSVSALVFAFLVSVFSR